MRQTILLMAVLALVGCGKKTTPAEPEAKPEPNVGRAGGPAPRPTAGATKDFTNTLGMKFVPGTEVRFCIWETRVKDYAAAKGAGNYDERLKGGQH